MGEAHEGCKYCLGGILMIYNKEQQVQLISCQMHILWRSNGWKSGPSLKAHHYHMQECGFQYKDEDNADGMETRYNSSNGNYAYRGT